MHRLYVLASFLVILSISLNHVVQSIRGHSHDEGQNSGSEMKQQELDRHMEPSRLVGLLAGPKGELSTKKDDSGLHEIHTSNAYEIHTSNATIGVKETYDVPRQDGPRIIQHGSSWMDKTTQSVDAELRQNIFFADDPSREIEADELWGDDGLSEADHLHQKYTASMVMIMLLGVLGIVHSTQASDDLLRHHTYNLLNTILAIVCALFVVDGQHWLWMMIFHEGLGVQEDIADLLTVVLFFVWYLGITVACRKLGEDHLACHIWVEGIITHVAAFTVIEIVHHPIEHFAHPVARAFPGSEGAMLLYKGVWVVAVWFLFGVSSCVSHCLRVRWSFAGPGVEVCEECEADASAIAAGYCYMQFIWSLAQPGVVTPAECVKPFCTASMSTLRITLVIFLVMCVAVVLYASKVSKWVSDHSKNAVYIETHLAMMVGWTGSLLVDFSLLHLPHSTEVIWRTAMSKQFLASIWCGITWVFTVFLVGYAHRRNILHKDSFTKLLKALSLVLAVCLEKVYGWAVSILSVTWSQVLCRAVGINYVSYMRFVTVPFMWCCMFGLALPAWKWYVAPQLLHGHDEPRADDDHLIHMHEQQAPNKEEVTRGMHEQQAPNKEEVT